MLAVQHVSDDVAARWTSLRGFHADEITYGVASLEVDGTRARELADQAFARSEPGHDATRRHALHDVLARPGDEMAVVDQVFLSGGKL
jgi:hypothetical protein